ncbi:HPr family phosphocarrier protein [Paenibacillus sp.]|uniref:HPr family phosphocarrier protein n=1 Tax=Paenibacillus sp. TaxID=58172 RepID=UPI002D246C8D|nr:HPr family phosphocarrier protein [Paenibacillus sp.]HZG85658.1 HPr family phosphocarrier protein [Paenibacillus sp.]
MYEVKATIQNKDGFHIRPAQLFTEKALAYQSTIHLATDGADVDGKSILGLMTLGLRQGSVVTIKAEGPDEREAAEALAALIESGFGEA